jgi:hypothetical protein
MGFPNNIIGTQMMAIVARVFCNPNWYSAEDNKGYSTLIIIEIPRN